MKRLMNEISNDQPITQFISKKIKLENQTAEFPCDECDKSFTQRGNLERHISNIHTKEKPYVCNICHKNFSDGGSLTRHRRIHTGQMPYSCTTCPKKFTDQSNCIKHIQSHVSLALRIKESIIKEFDTSLPTQEFTYAPLENLPFKEAIQKLEWTS